MSNHRHVERQAERFKALGNPHRLAVFQRLLSCCAPGTACAADRAERLCVGELGEGMDIAPSTVSHHLKELARAGLIRSAKRGKTVECWIDRDVVEELATFFAAPLTEGDEGND